MLCHCPEVSLRVKRAFVDELLMTVRDNGIEHVHGVFRVKLHAHKTAYAKHLVGRLFRIGQGLSPWGQLTDMILMHLECIKSQG